MINDERDAVKALTELSNTLKALEKSDHINIFDAVGMATQEVKHSAFLAWLLNPKQTHKQGNAFLLAFLKAVYAYAPTVADENAPSNADILTDGFIADIERLAVADDIEVVTEKTVISSDSRIDVFIRSEAAKITVVIENKIFTSTHDNQLLRYEREVSGLDGEKIFIYLTPDGDIPTDVDGNRQDGWCVFDYGAILDILKSRLKELRGKANARLRYLTEDYISMVDDRILHNNPAIRALCKKIKREHADALEILNSYTDNTEEVCLYICETWLPKNFPDTAGCIRKGKIFYTASIADYYARHGQSMRGADGLFRFQISVEPGENSIYICMFLSKNPDDAWTAADIKLRDILQPDKKPGNKYCTLYSAELLGAEEREKPFDERLKSVLNERLSAFAVKLRELERALATA